MTYNMEKPILQTKWYHAGSVDDVSGTEVWSMHSRRTYEKASDEAQCIARQNSGRPVVEYWAYKHGPQPYDCEVVEGAEYID